LLAEQTNACQSLSESTVGHGIGNLSIVHKVRTRCFIHAGRGWRVKDFHACLTAHDQQSTSNTVTAQLK
jgi:hypothetical protein